MDKSPSNLLFLKMHGLGNDFVVMDMRAEQSPLSDHLVRALADRHRGIGFDQLAVILPAQDDDARLAFYNADGSQSGACGNATRCIADHLMRSEDKEEVRLRTAAGALNARRTEAGEVAVNMGPPRLDWQEIPLSEAVDTAFLPIEGEPSATSMGNPHCSFFVDDLDAVELELLGPKYEHHPLFPERTNVQFARVIAENHIRVRVWERGSGHTLASGSSSCAVAVAAIRRGLVPGPEVLIELEGGTLMVAWRPDGVWMKGPVAHVFSGQITPEFLASLL